jgi:hypothetical protein
MSDQSIFLRSLRQSTTAESSGCAKCSGAITPQMKLCQSSRKNYPDLFSNISNIGDEIVLRVVGLSHPSFKILYFKLN